MIQDLIKGIDPTFVCFWQKVFELFSAASLSDATNDQYRAKGRQPTRANMEHVAADLEYFRCTSRNVSLFHPTGVDENQNLSIPISKHLTRARQ